MEKELLTTSQIYTKGREYLKKIEYKRVFPPDSDLGTAIQANRKYLDSLFFAPSFLDPFDNIDTGLTLFGVKLKTPVFCSPLSNLSNLSDTALTDIARGLKNAGSLMMLGIGGSPELQSAIDTGVPVVKIVKPYRRTELIFEKVRDAESRGCVAVGMDIDHSYGRLSGDKVDRTELFCPQSTDTLRQVISQTRLPFIVKGVISLQDAEKAVQMGASAIIVSSHAGSAIGFTIPPIIALPEIVEKVGDKLTVLIDTGFKTGNDVLKALALGARGVGFGGSILLGWGAGGAQGVENLINQITAELHRTMAATGCPDLPAITKSIITRVPPLGE